MRESVNTNKPVQVQMERTTTVEALPVTGDGVDLEAITTALLSDSSVKECVVVKREVQPGTWDLVAYVIVTEQNFDQIEPRLRERAGELISAVVPVAYLPVTEDGAIDAAALARVPVWSADLASAWEAQVAALPEIDRVVSVSGYWADTPRHVHIAKLLRESSPPAPVPQRAEAAFAVTPVITQSAGDVPAALCHGQSIPQHADAPQVLPAVLCAAPESACIIYIDREGSERVTSYGALLQEARRVLGGLRQHGLKPGDKVIFQLDCNDDILPAFWGCLLGGFEPVIVPMPLTYDGESRALDHLNHIWTLFDRPLLLTVRDRVEDIRKALPPPLRAHARLAALEELRDNPPDMNIHSAVPDDIAFYTLSSGSTGLPKAVMLTHRSILARARGTNLLCQQSAEAVIFNWLPFDHIGSISDWHLRCIVLGCTLIYAPKEYVLGSPLRWLDLIHRHRITHSWAPNFAYSLVSAALKGERQREWDLSCVKMLLTAGESITRTTTSEFLDSLAPYGLQLSVLQTAFGMAEVGSGVTYHQPAAGKSLTFHYIDRNTLGGALQPADPEASTCVAFASLGPVIPGVSMRIVDEEQRVVPEGTTGRLQLKGDALSSGYYNNPEANKVFLANGWFDTGDVGFISGGELMLTGRADAGIIINGANFYNNEIEAVVEQVDGVAASFTVACAVRPPDSDAQKLAVFFHTPYGDDGFLRKLLRAIQLRLTKQLGIKADFLIPLDRDAIPKTAIGKLQRKKLVEQFYQGVFQDILERLDLFAANEHTLPEWFYKQVWHRKDLVGAPQKQQGACLVLLDRLGLGQQMVAELTARGVTCVVVEASETFAQRGATHFSIRPEDPRHYHIVLETLRDSGVQIGSVVHLFSYDADLQMSESREGIERTQQQGFYSMLFLVQALAALASHTPVRLLAVSSNAQAILAHEASAYAKATLPGLLHTVSEELSWLRCLHIDCPAEAYDTYAPAITREVLGALADREVAYRGNQRWVSGLQQVPVATSTNQQSRDLPFQRHGVYLVNNGLEGIGPHVAEFLLTRFKARLVLLGKEPLPTDEHADQGTTDERQAIYHRLRQLSGNCVYAAVDIQDAEALQRALDGPLAQWGATLDGAIHLAASPSQRSLLEESKDTLATTFVPEVAGVWSLVELLRKQRGSVFITVSSAAHVLDAGGRCAVAASSAFQDRLISHLEKRGNLHVYGLSVAALDDLVNAPAHTHDSAHAQLPVAVRRIVNSIIVGLQLGEARLVVGLDGDSPLLRARMFAGPLELRKTSLFFTAHRSVSREQLGALPLVDRYGAVAHYEYVQMREPESAGSEQIELWPSVAEYYVYDDLIYYALANDERRNRKYRVALEKTVRDKVVLDIGTGKEAILARLAVEAGARKVYAIEMGDEAFAQASSYIQQLGLDDRITMLHGNSAAVELPELVDVCVSEIVGPIGGCEGAAVVINDAQRFLRPGGVMIPSRSVTRIAAVSLPDALLSHPGFYRVPGTYTEKIFAQIGYPFDLRVCIKKFPHTHLLSNSAVFEDLDFSQTIPLAQQHEIELVIDQASRFDGFLVWLNLQTIDCEVIDIIEHEYSWLPVYMPVFCPGIDVTPGDRITAKITRTVCDNGLNPDFVINGTLVRTNGERRDFTHGSYHHQQRYKQHPFYERLFSEDEFGRHPGCRPDSALQHLPEMPLTAAGQIDVHRLQRLAQGQEPEAAARQVPVSEMELQIAKVWQDILEVPEVGVHDNFFELGGHSLLLVQAHTRLTQMFGSQLTLVDLFKCPTIHSLVQLLSNGGSQDTAPQRGMERAQARNRFRVSEDKGMIAVVGMACRFPGADTLDDFWRNLATGVESITFFSEDELLGSGIDPAVARHPNYVPASPLLSDVESFDAGFFGYTAREATLMDPQHRLLLECAWETLETAGYNPLTYPGAIGVYAGASMNTYLLNNVYPNRDTLDTHDSLRVTTLDSMGGFQLMVANDKDYLTTRLSYKLNLRGPSINVQTACSTGLVAIHLACQSLLSGEGDMFLAAGSSVQVPHRAGHLFQDGMIVSPDGHCRAFDAQAKGTIFGSGVGVVLLKRLEDAVRDRDHIFAVIKGSAVNNDGGMKVGYMAPSAEGQATVVAEAMAIADVAPDTIGFVEAHGTGTEMGDPIEVNALAQAFRAHTTESGFCALGSVKTNVGHLQIASGMVGFIKTVLALQHQMIPPTLHFQKPNPGIDFENSPFYVATTPTPWKATSSPRRAGVNSLGIGGTNSHVILEEAPPMAAVENTVERPQHILVLSARTETALSELASRYVRFLTDHPETSLADICFTANTGRKLFEHRLAVVAESVAQLRDDLSRLASGESRAIRGQATTQAHDRIAFLFTGQGSQCVGMGRQLYETQPIFRQHLDHCAEILRPMLDVQLLDVLYPADPSTSPLNETAYTQPALFALEYALAQLWKSWGITPSIVMGHSLGEYVAACIAGVFSLENGLTLVTHRARLMQALPHDGEMLVVFASKAQVQPCLAPFSSQVAIAAENGPDHTVISGRTEAVASIRSRLHEAGVTTQKVNTSHAFHSPLMAPMLNDFARVAAQIAYAAPQIEIVSNLTGEVIADEIASPEYWCRHIRQPVQFRSGMETLAQRGYQTFIEIGPKPTLLGMGARCVESDTAVWLPSLRQGQSDWQQLLFSLGRLAVCAPVDWTGFDSDYQRRRVPLPTYPFERQRYWLDRPASADREVHISSQSHISTNSLLGTKLHLPTLKITIYENHFSTQALPFLQDHRVFGKTLVSGTSYIAMLLAAISQTRGHGAYAVKDIYFLQPLIIPEGQSRTVQVILTPAGETTTLQLVSFAEATYEAEPSVSTHVEAVVHWGHQVTRANVEAQQVVWQRCQQDVSVDTFFATQAARHIDLGPSYRWFEGLRRGEREAVCRLRVPESLGGLDAKLLHPGFLDACLSLALVTADLAEGETWLPFRIEEVRVHQEPDPTQSWAHVTLRDAGETRRLVADVRIYDQHGQATLEFVGLEARPAKHDAVLRHLPVTADDRLYQRSWLPIAVDHPRRLTDKPGQWLIFADQQGTAYQLAQQLRAQGARCVLVAPGQIYSVNALDDYCINPTQPQDFTRLLVESVGKARAYDGVVHLWSVDESSLECEDWRFQGQTLTCASTLYLVQALVKANWAHQPRLWLISRGGQSVGTEPALPHLQQAPLWGLGQVVRLEHPELQCTCVDLDPTASAPDATDLLATLNAADEGAQIAWRQGVRYVTRLLQQPELASGNQTVVRADASYLITGGTGGLGLRTAGWLVTQGARNLILVARRQISQIAREAIKDMEQTGAKVHVVQADVSDRDAMTEVFGKIHKSLPSLRGVIHCAGGIEDGMLIEQSWQRFQRVLPAKVDGAWLLHEHTQNLDLDFFVLFSSAASVLGNQGQGNYAAANAFLDELAHYRRSKGLVATSINWGPWAQIGIAMSDPAIQQRMSRQGFVGIKPGDGLALLGKIVTGDVTQVIAMNWNWQTYLSQLTEPHSLFAELMRTSRLVVSETNGNGSPEILGQLKHPLPENRHHSLSTVVSATVTTNGTGSPDILGPLRFALPENRKHILSTFVHNTVRRVLGVSDSQPLDLTKPLIDQGLDSLMAVQMRNAIASGLQRPLPVSLVFNYPTVNDIVNYVETQLGEFFADIEPATSPPRNPVQPEPSNNSPLATAQALLAELNELLSDEA